MHELVFSRIAESIEEFVVQKKHFAQKEQRKKDKLIIKDNKFSVSINLKHARKNLD